MMDVKTIQEYLPHRFPFLLVDRIIDIKEGESITGIKNVTINEWFFQGHFPGKPVMPGVLIIEAMAQTAGVLMLSTKLKGEKGKILYFMTIDAVKFRKPVVPGDQLKMMLKLVKFNGRIGKFHGDTYVGEELVAEADMMAIIGDKEEKIDSRDCDSK